MKNLLYVKKLLLLFLVCFLPVTAAASVAEDTTDDFVMFKIGYLSPSIDIENASGDKVSIDPGTYYELSYMRRYGTLGIRAAIGYAHNSCDKSIDHDNGNQEFYKADLYSLNIPVTFMYVKSTERIDFYTGIGPGFYYRKMNIDYSTNTGIADSDNGSSYNVGMQALIGFDFRVYKNLALGLDLECNFFGVNFNINSANPGTAGELNPSFTISYSF